MVGDAVSTVDAVNVSPLPSSLVFHPAKVYPLRTGGAGSVPTVVVRPVTVFVVGLASVSPPFLSKFTMQLSGVQMAYTLISSVTTVDDVNVSPRPSLRVFHSAK